MQPDKFYSYNNVIEVEVERSARFCSSLRMRILTKLLLSQHNILTSGRCRREISLVNRLCKWTDTLSPSSLW